MFGGSEVERFGVTALGDLAFCGSSVQAKIDWRRGSLAVLATVLDHRQLRESFLNLLVGLPPRRAPQPNGPSRISGVWTCKPSLRTFESPAKRRLHVAEDLPLHVRTEYLAETTTAERLMLLRVHV